MPYALSSGRCSASVVGMSPRQAAPFEFEISRRLWLAPTPGNGGPTVLHRAADGKMCCLGHYLHACGVSKATMTNYMSPSQIWQEVSETAQWLLDRRVPVSPSTVSDSAAGIQLIRLNDKIKWSLAVREKRITQQFAKRGITVRFVP